MDEIYTEISFCPKPREFRFVAPPTISHKAEENKLVRPCSYGITPQQNGDNGMSFCRKRTKRNRKSGTSNFLQLLCCFCHISLIRFIVMLFPIQFIWYDKLWYVAMGSNIVLIYFQPCTPPLPTRKACLPEPPDWTLSWAGAIWAPNLSASSTVPLSNSPWCLTWKWTCMVSGWFFFYVLSKLVAAKLAYFVQISERNYKFFDLNQGFPTRGTSRAGVVQFVCSSTPI